MINVIFFSRSQRLEIAATPVVMRTPHAPTARVPSHASVKMASLVTEFRVSPNQLDSHHKQ